MHFRNFDSQEDAVEILYLHLSVCPSLSVCPFIP